MPCERPAGRLLLPSLLLILSSTLGGLPAAVRAGSPIVLPERQVFPGEDGASPATLDRPLAGLIQEWKERTGKRTFRKRIVIHKSRRRMDVFADEALLKSYLVELGPSPSGDKRKQGDMKTPEGDLFVCSRNRASQFTRFLNLAYPTPASARAAVADGRVGAAVERQVQAAFRQRDRCPPQGTRLGGAVGIHGGAIWEKRAEGYALVDWTWGCVAVRDADILELFNGYAEVGTPVRIEAD